MEIETYLNRLSENNLVIFLFHGVIRQCAYKVRNYNRKHIFDYEFAKLINSLLKKGCPLSIDEVVYKITYGYKFNKNSFAISFDDGFENNYSIAAPILDEFKVPAVFYLTSKFIDDNYMSWIDQVDYAIENTKENSIKLNFMKNALDISSIEKKISFLNMLRAVIKSSKEMFLSKESIIKEIFDKSKVSEIMCNHDQIDLKMTWKQVELLNNSNLFTIGGHTHTHPIMSYLTLQELEQEIEVCLTKIATAIKEHPKHFSYPEGIEYCYNDSVVDSLKSYNIICSPSAIDGVNCIQTDLFNLKRITVV